MFLNKNNQIKWKSVIWATCIVIALCFLGVFWFDVPLFIFMRRFNGVIASFVDNVFSLKIWLIVLGIALAIVYILNIKNGIKQISGLKKYFPYDLWKNRKKIFHNELLFTLFSIFCSVLLAGFIGWILKIVIGRMRPIFLEALGLTGFYPFTTEWAFNSMPSGHTVASFAGLVMIGLIYPKYKWLTWTLAILIGLMRIAFGAHFPTDVLLGAFIGMITADFVKSKI